MVRLFLKLVFAEEEISMIWESVMADRRHIREETSYYRKLNGILNKLKKGLNKNDKRGN